MKSKIKKEYNKLEKDIIIQLKEKIDKSNIISKFCNEKVIKIDNLFNYTELGLIDNKLVFFDSNGYQYNLYTDCSLEDLIDLL